MKFTLPKIYPITDTRLSGLSHAEQVMRLIKGGAQLIQLREKIAPPSSFIKDARAAVEIARASGATVIVNDRVDVALAMQADGVHLGQSDMPVVAARKLLGGKAIIGLSTHNSEQAREALKLPIDYLGFGPIFGTRTKHNPDPVVGLAQLRLIKSMVGSLPVVAIGGIDESRIVAALTAGADSVAVISAVLSDAERIPENLSHLTYKAENHRSAPSV